jgi:hypothetical protein
MKHLKTYKKLFEGSELDPDQWEDVKDIIQSEVLDKHHISFDDTEEKLGNYSGKYKVYDPVFSIKFDNLELSPYIIDDIYKLNRRVKELTGNFIIAKNNVNMPSKRNIEIMLSKTPDHRIVGEHFNLEECETDNIIDRKSGFLCGDYNTGYETSVKILEWLNTFYRFCYPTEFEAFKLAYDTLSELYDVLIVFSMPTFEDDRFKQVVCFQFILSSKRGGESVIGNKFPIFIINTNHTESPQIRKRVDGYNWIDIPFDKRERYIDFLKTEQF